MGNRAPSSLPMERNSPCTLTASQCRWSSAMENPNHMQKLSDRICECKGYKFQIVHTKGSTNPSDFLSRHTIIEPKREEKMAEDDFAVPQAMTLSEPPRQIRVTLKRQSTQESGIHFCHHNQDGIDDAQIKQFVNVKDELTVNAKSDLILRGSRIVIPTTLQQKAVDIAHKGHQGIVKAKKLLRVVSWN